MAEIAYLTDLVKLFFDEFKTLRADNVKLHEKNDLMYEELKTLRADNAKLHEKIDLMHEELKPKKRGTPKAPVVPKVQCIAIAASSGNRCKCRAKEGKDVCEKHEKQRQKQQSQQVSTSSPQVTGSLVPKKKPRLKKDGNKKITPVHNHPIGEPPRDGVICDLCENHGDIFDPNIADPEFEILPENGQSIEERYLKLLPTK